MDRPSRGPGREAHLVVRDQVDRPAGRVAIEARQVERLGDDALGRERRVAVDEDRQRRRGVGPRDRPGSVRLLRAGAALDHRIDRLEVARVRRQDDAHLGVVGREIGALRAEVVLHVVGPALRRGRGLDACPSGLELGEDRLVADPDHVRQDVQPAAVCHADHHLAGALVRGVAEDDVEHRHEGIEPLDAEAFLAEVGLVQEALERLDAHEALEQCDAVIGLHRSPMLARLDHAAEPDALGVRGDVLDLVGDRPGVRLTEVRERLRQRRARHVDPHELGRDLGHGLARSGRVAPGRERGRRAARSRGGRDAPPCARSGGTPSRAPCRRRRP